MEHATALIKVDVTALGADVGLSTLLSIHRLVITYEYDRPDCNPVMIQDVVPGLFNLENSHPVGVPAHPESQLTSHPANTHPLALLGVHVSSNDEARGAILPRDTIVGAAAGTAGANATDATLTGLFKLESVHIRMTWNW
jgi:hypothetical protein